MNVFRDCASGVRFVGQGLAAKNPIKAIQRIKCIWRSRESLRLWYGTMRWSSHCFDKLPTVDITQQCVSSDHAVQQVLRRCSNCASLVIEQCHAWSEIPSPSRFESILERPGVALLVGR